MQNMGEMFALEITAANHTTKPATERVWHATQSHE